MKANASKSEIEAYFDLAEKVDADEDALYGAGQQPQDLPAELRRREDRLAKIREVRAALKKETAKARALELQRQAEELRCAAKGPYVAKEAGGAD